MGRCTIFPRILTAIHNVGRSEKWPSRRPDSYLYGGKGTLDQSGFMR